MVQKKKKILVTGFDELQKIRLTHRFLEPNNRPGMVIEGHLQDIGHVVETLTFEDVLKSYGGKYADLIEAYGLIIINDTDPNIIANMVHSNPRNGMDFYDRIKESGIPIVTISKNPEAYIYVNRDPTNAFGIHYLFERNGIKRKKLEDILKLLLEHDSSMRPGYSVKFLTQDFPKSLEMTVNRHLRTSLKENWEIPFAYHYSRYLRLAKSSYKGLTDNDFRIDVIADDFGSLHMAAIFALMLKYPSKSLKHQEISDNKGRLPVISGNFGYMPEHVEIELMDFSQRKASSLHK